MISKVLSAALIEPTKLKRHVAELSKQDGWLGNPDTLYWCLARPICFATRAGSQVVRGILNPQHPLYTGGEGGYTTRGTSRGSRSPIFVCVTESAKYFEPGRPLASQRMKRGAHPQVAMRQLRIATGSNATKRSCGNYDRSTTEEYHQGVSLSPIVMIAGGASLISRCRHIFFFCS